MIFAATLTGDKKATISCDSTPITVNDEPLHLSLRTSTTYFGHKNDDIQSHTDYDYDPSGVLPRRLITIIAAYNGLLS